jgi:hypothetical protein
MPERSMYIWNMPRNASARLALRATLIATGCETIWVKAGGDDGYAWTPTQPSPPAWLRPQWSDAWLDDFAPLATLPWFYIWPRETEYNAVALALRSRMADTLALNPETEWRVQSSVNPYRNLAEANRGAEAWVDKLRRRLREEFGREFRIGFSGVPSWTDFPYEGFDAACDFSHPQHYWPAHLMARNEDQIRAHLRRVGKAKPCVPILTVAREYGDEGAYALAETAVRDYPDLAGFSGWVAGENPYQSEVMRKAYLLLPPRETRTTPQRPEGWLNVGDPDVFTWEGAQGVIVERESVWYNPEESKYYRLRWHHERGFAPAEEIA